MIDEERALGVSPTLSSATAVSNGVNPNTAAPSVENKAGGYHKLAEFMADYPEAAIFRRFKMLHVLKLLYLQAELTGLERNLKSKAREDAQSSDVHRQDYCRNYYKLCYSLTDAGVNKDNNEQLEVWARIDEVLKEYDKTLCYVRTVLNMPKIDEGDLSLLRGWMLNDGNIRLTGIDKDTWDSTTNANLVAMRSSNHDDFVSSWVDTKVVPWYNKFIGIHYKKKAAADSACAGTISYQDGHVGLVISVIVVSIASGMPIAAIAVLSRPMNPHLRMGLMASFTILFSLCLGMMSGGKKKIEVLAASAAFAAVQVVFIGNQAEATIKPN